MEREIKQNCVQKRNYYNRESHSIQAFRGGDPACLFCEGSAPRNIRNDEATPESKKDHRKKQKPGKSRISALRSFLWNVFDFCHGNPVFRQVTASLLAFKGSCHATASGLPVVYFDSSLHSFQVEVRVNRF